VKNLLLILLVGVALLASFSEDIYVSVWPPEAGKTLYLTYRSKTPFSFDQEKAFGSKREVAVSQYTPLYTYIPEATEAGKKKMKELIQKVTGIQSQPQRDGGEFDKYIKKQFGIELGVDSAAALLQYPNIANLLQAVMAVEDSILQSRIVEDPKPLKGKKTVEVLFPKPLGTVAFPAAEVITLEQAREILQGKISQVFWQVEKRILDPVVRIAQASIGSNLKYDQVENDRRIEEIARRYPSKTVRYNAGDVLVPFRKVLVEEDVLLLSAHQETAKMRPGNGSVFWVFFAIAFSVGAYAFFAAKLFDFRSSGRRPLLLHLSVMVMAIVLMELFLLLTSFPIYALPVAFVPLLIFMLHREKIFITLSSILVVLLVSFFVGRSLQILLFFGFGSLMAIMATPVIRKRSHVFLPSLLVGCTNAAVVLFALMDGKAHFGWLPVEGQAGIQQLVLENTNILFQMGWAFVGGFVAGPFALLLLPLMERVWKTASTFKLFKYTDLDHPLMKDLLTKAPGTYQHTMTVAHLAQGAGEAIGADSLLVRIGSYYHDVGKTSAPNHFVENQFGGGNLHQELSPQESAKIITDHVEEGLKLAREAGLPEVVQEFIAQHHGTRLLEYFHDKACNSCGEGRVPEGDFRYQGPKPQRVETAIVMIADAVEAASRSLQEKTREKIDAMILHIIQARIADGQFDECSLSTRDLAGIRAKLAESLAASFHTRVEYPWQKEPGNSPKKEDSSKTIPFRISSV
jgi:putative nucleotidyltransferase with HDIG domain